MTNKPNLILVQKDEPFCHSTEALCCVSYQFLHDVPLKRVYLEELSLFSKELSDPTTLAVGTVEFLKKCFEIKNKTLPFNSFDTYPSCFESFYQQKITKTTLKAIDWQNIRQFIKPVVVKQFNAFCLNSQNPQDLSEIDYAKSLSPLCEVYCCSLLDIDQEWRVYVADNKALCFSRYDDNSSPDFFDYSFVKSVLDCSSLRHPFALDVARLKDGSWTIVECNDAWAIGLYNKCMSPTQYINWLYQRWLLI